MLAELFLQDLGATFVSRPTADTGIDFIVAFPNGQGGTNLSAVEVKATEHPVGDFYPLETKWYKRLAHSNVPSLLLVVDAKQNRLYHAWPSPDDVNPKSGVRRVRIPIEPIDEEVKEQIRERLAGIHKPAPAGGHR
ncbi:MAG: DUF4365 domain-containing protein [Bryobacteraceae bacterium]